MWEQENNCLCKIFEFDNFSQAFAFMTQVAMLAEKHNHHPQWSNVWNKVEIKLTTHEAGNMITEKDRNLANEIDKILLPRNS